MSNISNEIAFNLDNDGTSHFQYPNENGLYNLHP